MLCDCGISEHERALAGYMKYPKKREGEKARQEAVDDLYVSRKKFHQVKTMSQFVYSSVTVMMKPFFCDSRHNCLIEQVNNMFFFFFSELDALVKNRLYLFKCLWW